MRVRRLVGLLLIAMSIAALSACGSREDAPPGTPENPLVNNPDKLPVEGRSAEAESASKRSAPSFNAILEQQSKRRGGGATRRAGDAANPCGFVTKAQAEKILGARLLDPFVAPQGPTCVYRNRSGSTFATVAVESLDFDHVRPRIARVKRVEVLGRSAYCGVHGRPMLYLPLSGSRVLSVAAPCETALRFARRAAPRLLGSEDGER